MVRLTKVNKGQQSTGFACQAKRVSNHLSHIQNKLTAHQGALIRSFGKKAKQE